MKQWVKDQFFSLLNIIQFKYYRFKANREHQLTGKRYFVIPKNKYSLMVVNNDYVRRYNIAAARLNYKKITIVDLLRDCYYCTEMGTTGSRRKKPVRPLNRRSASLQTIR
jgi:hypothetical protein